jgi:hypothetical protein
MFNFPDGTLPYITVSTVLGPTEEIEESKSSENLSQPIKKRCLRSCDDGKIGPCIQQTFLNL